MRRFSTALLIATFLALSAIAAQAQSAPTLRIVTEDPTLPSELFYGAVKVKPLRLRPGTTTPITIDDSDFFVQQQYIDFLSRFPEAQGFSAWMNVLAPCNSDPNCLDGVNGKRVLVSQSFFQSTEFQLKGFFVYRFYKLSFNRLPLYSSEIVPDMRSVTGTTSADVYARRAAYANAWVNRSDFKATYDPMDNATFVNTLMSRYSLSQITAPDPANPDGTTKVTLRNADLTSGLNNGTLNRAKVVRAIVESDEVFAAEYNKAFVAMQYYGYLRRDPEQAGYNDWLNYLNAHPGDYKTMVWGFVYSQEYRSRF